MAAWVSGADPHIPEQVLTSAGAHQWAVTLGEMRGEAHKTIATVRMVMTRALSFMADPALATSVLPGPFGGFDIAAFLYDAGTLYLIAEAVSSEAPVAPLFAAMASEIHYAAAQIGQASPGGRLDPPLLMGLDEVTQICPVPLPFWLADSGGKGIQVTAVAHGEAQLVERWGEHGRQVILDTCSVKVFLPGITDTTTLEAAGKLCGQASWRVRGQEHSTRHDVATPDMIRQLPAGHALVIRGGYAPVVARLPRAWKNPAYRRVRREQILLPPAAPMVADLPPEPIVPDHVPSDWIPEDGTSFPLELSMSPDPLPAALDQLAAHHEQIARLERIVHDLQRTLARLIDSLPAGCDADEHPPNPAPKWWKLPADQRREPLSRLRAWVEQVYWPGYGHRASALGPCWEAHDLCLYGLDILAELWSVLYLQDQRTPGLLSAQAEYQARIVAALSAQFMTETTGCGHARPSGARAWSTS